MAEDTREKEIAHREAAARRSVDEYYVQDAKNRPTPSQAEVDRAKLGLPVDEPEADGSPPEEETQRRVLESRLPGGNPYDTRALAPDAEAPRRGPGRPPARKPEGE